MREIKPSHLGSVLGVFLSSLLISPSQEPGEAMTVPFHGEETLPIREGIAQLVNDRAGT